MDAKELLKYMDNWSTFMGNMTIADESVTEIKFACVGKFPGNICDECKTNWITFVTLNVKEAAEHSERNNIPFWVIDHTKKEE